MDCNHARLLLTFARPLATELEESEAHALANHLTDCPACAALERSERRLDAPIAAAMRAVPVPAGLRERLLGQLARDRAVLNRRRWMRRGVAVAAAVLVAFGAWSFLAAKPLALNLETVYWRANNLPNTPAEVEEWFQQNHRTTMTAPTAFNYALLAHCTMADFEGKRVPLLEFRNRTESAWVYVLDAGQFDLRSLEGQGSLSGAATFFVEWQREPANPRIAYVIIYTSGGLEQFKKTAQAT
jgi:hypothetical protein